METEERRYWIQTGSMGSIVLGAFLLIEHIATWGGSDMTFPYGHEYYGLYLILAGFIASLFSRKKKDEL